MHEVSRLEDLLRTTASTVLALRCQNPSPLSHPLTLTSSLLELLVQARLKKSYQGVALFLLIHRGPNRPNLQRLCQRHDGYGWYGWGLWRPSTLTLLEKNPRKSRKQLPSTYEVLRSGERSHSADAEQSLENVDAVMASGTLKDCNLQSSLI